MKGIAFFTLLMAAAGALLAATNIFTREKIEINNDRAKDAKLLQFVESTDPDFLCEKNSVLVQISEKGYGGNINLAVLFKSDKLAGARAINHNETPGFDRILEPENWIGKFGAVTDIDAVTGATITSQAILRGVKSAEEERASCQMNLQK